MSVELGMPTPELHPRHGLHDPGQRTPVRLPGSMRRTSSIDILRELDDVGRVRLVGSARDLRTGGDGTAIEVQTATMTADVDMFAGAELLGLETDPSEPALTSLVGQSAMGGYRHRLDSAIPQVVRARALVHLLLDDIPGSIVISGHALTVLIDDPAQELGYLPVADQCAGFVTGGTMMTAFETGSSFSPTGPVAGPLNTPGDPLAWHAMNELKQHAMRRRRRIDVSPLGERQWLIDAMFRDTYVRDDGIETVIHEYELSATVDAETGIIGFSRATPRVLPWVECPAAVASASRLEGMDIETVHQRVRRELRGTSTCTHLNDVLRNLSDVPALAAMLPANADVLASPPNHAR